ncbi:MAG: phosphonate metabolism protein/1,5-bisphosphokinase (PRPP-forming) PhnN [Marinibacterium sp.]
MSNARQSGRVVAVVGPSGVGKDSVMAALVAADPAFVSARRVITRPAEAGGEEFDSVSEDEFARRVAAGAFLFHWQAHGLSYGVPRSIAGDLAAGRTVLVNFSRAALLDAQAAFPDLQVIALTADPGILAARLAGRGRETAAEQARRFSRRILALPEGLKSVFEIDNGGPLEDTVAVVRARLQGESV